MCLRGLVTLGDLASSSGRSYDIVQISLEMFQSGGRIMLSAIHIIKYNHNMGQLSQKKKGQLLYLLNKLIETDE